MKRHKTVVYLSNSERTGILQFAAKEGISISEAARLLIRQALFARETGDIKGSGNIKQQPFISLASHDDNSTEEDD